MSYPPPGDTPDPPQPPAPAGSADWPTTPFTPPVEPYAPPAGGAVPPGPYGQAYDQVPGTGYGQAPGQGYAQAPGYDQVPGGYAGPQAYPPYGQTPYGPPYAPPYGGYGMQSRTNGLAIASLVCSLAGLATCISAPVGIVLGHIAKRQIRETGEQGDGLATAGLWVGYLLSGLSLLVIAGYAVVIALAVSHDGS